MCLQILKKSSQREAKYQAVVRNLVKRYVTNMQRNQQAEGVSEDDVNEIKQDISSFRYELLEILKNGGIGQGASAKGISLHELSHHGFYLKMLI